MFQKIKAWFKLLWIEWLINNYDETIENLIALEKERTLGIYQHMNSAAELKSYRIKMQDKADKLKHRLGFVKAKLEKLGVTYN